MGSKKDTSGSTRSQSSTKGIKTGPALMATLTREELSERTKEELLDYIEQQAEQLGRFEARFRGKLKGTNLTFDLCG